MMLILTEKVVILIFTWASEQEICVMGAKIIMCSAVFQDVALNSCVCGI